VITYDAGMIEFAKECFAEIKDLSFRIYDDPKNETRRERDPYQRDYGRILYSSSFRRLQGKMQLLGLDPSHFHRNRLTHSLEVAQTARSIASSLEIPDPTVAETCSLAHDLGNPPFGHRGEQVLDEIAEGIGGFEGNAQTLRIISFLEKKSFSYRGLNLTYRTLLGVTKYFNKRGEEGKEKKKFIYNEDFDLLENIFIAKGLINRRTIDVQIMDLADEIAYAAHDLEDSLAFGLLAIDELIYEFRISSKYGGAYDRLLEIVKECQNFAFGGSTFGTSEEYSFLFRKELTSKIVHSLIADIHVSDKGSTKELGFKDGGVLSEGLKKLLFKAVLRKRSVQNYEKVGEKVINGLFQVYYDNNFNKDGLLLPPEYRSAKDDNDRMRMVVDYIAGMMDSFAIQEYKKYFGEGSLNKLYPIDKFRDSENGHHS
jgi:dGTPase